MAIKNERQLKEAKNKIQLLQKSLEDKSSLPSRIAEVQKNDINKLIGEIQDEVRAYMEKLTIR